MHCKNLLNLASTHAGISVSGGFHFDLTYSFGVKVSGVPVSLWAKKTFRWMSLLGVLGLLRCYWWS